MSHEHGNAAPNNPDEPERNPEQEASGTHEHSPSPNFEAADSEYDSFSDSIESPDATPSEVDQQADNTDQARIKQLEEELERTKELMMRTVAEAENGRKRALKEREDASKFAVAGFSRDMLSVADNLRRALEAVTEEDLAQNPQIKNLTEGVEATERELLRTFEKNGIEKLDPLDDVFDPNFHEVMFEAPMPDKDNGTIIQVIEAGYTLSGRILRPAKVGVAKNEDSGSQTPPTSGPGQNFNTEV